MCLSTGGVLGPGGSARGGVPGPGGFGSRGGWPVPGGLLPGRCLVPGGSGPRGVPGGDPPPDGYCCGRYASYWNAFLFSII